MNFNDISNIYFGQYPISQVHFGENQIWPIGQSIGTTFDFNYTGTVQSINLPKGCYKLQAWGAQGGSITGDYTYSVNGSKGGYSEGILKLDEPKTLYVFVGGQGTSYSTDNSSTAIINGGWNGGGCGVRHSSYESGDEFGRSYPRPGGGATDFALVTSDMSYSSSYYRNNRSADSLNSRILVAGGGAGASAYYREITRIIENDSETLLISINDTLNFTHGTYGPAVDVISTADRFTVLPNTIYKWINFTGTRILTVFYDYSLSRISSTWNYEFTTPSNAYYIEATMYNSNGSLGDSISGDLYEFIQAGTTTNTDHDTSSTSKQGGGTSGKGQYPGTQSSAGTSGAFGFGANQNYTDYMYCAGGGGGGWYGGGTSKADSNVSYINYCGGGSGFVNIPSNAQYRPSGYTGLELESGQTIAGDTSFPSPSGGTETGHGGDGFARITFVAENGEGGSGGGSIGPSIEWTIQTGSWTSTNNSNAYDGLMWESNMHTDSGSTVIRCTFSGITNIKFDVLQNSEYNYDYLTAGELDTPCTRSSYSYTFKGLPSTGADDCQYFCDSGEHFVEFCYSKDGSDSRGTDSATVYISTVS